LERTSHGGLDVILLDVWLPGLDGLEALSRIQTMPHRCRHHDLRSRHIDTAVRATKLGAFDFIESRSVWKEYRPRSQRRSAAASKKKISLFAPNSATLSGDRRKHSMKLCASRSRHRSHQCAAHLRRKRTQGLVARSLHAASLRNKGLR